MPDVVMVVSGVVWVRLCKQQHRAMHACRAQVTETRSCFVLSACTGVLCIVRTPLNGVLRLVVWVWVACVRVSV